MALFRVLWGVDVLVAAIVVAFFAIGLADGSVSSFNLLLWCTLLAGVAVVVLGSRALVRRGRTAPGIGLAALVAVPALLYGALILVAVVGGGRWN